jgi:ABC-2 type transport system permease protein
MPGMKALVYERSSGITRRISTSSVKLWQIIISKLAVSIMLTTIQFIVIIFLTAIFFKNYWGAPLKSLLFLYVGVVFAISAWSIFVSSVSRTPAAADIIGNLGILLMAVVGGSIYPLSSMPEFIRSISKLTINRWAMDGFMVIFSGNDRINVLPDIYPLLLIGVVLLSASLLILKHAQRSDG